MTKRRQELGQDSNTNKKRKKTTPQDTTTPTIGTDPSEKLQDKLGFTLLQSPLDQPDLIDVGKVNLIDQFGCFAKTTIKAQTVIGEYTGEIIDGDNEEEDNDYYMSLPKNQLIDARLVGNFTRLINHSEYAANAVFEKTRYQKKTIMVIRTLVDIPEGKQILVDYGDAYKFHESTIFFNWDDNAVSANDFYNQNFELYEVLSLPQDFPKFNLKKDEFLAFPRIIKDSRRHLLANYPIFKIEGESILSYNQFDCISPLTWVVYSGNVQKVLTFLKHQADINRQQHKSGFTPLHFAVFGYEEEQTENYINIIKILIENHANLFITDKDHKTAIHYAALSLPPQNLKNIIDLISKEDFIRLLELIDTDNSDLLFSTIKNKNLDNLSILLEKAPNYFIKSFDSERKIRGRGRGKKRNACYYGTESFKSAIKAYTLDETEKLLSITTDYKIPANYNAIMKEHIKKLSEPQESVAAPIDEVNTNPSQLYPELRVNRDHTFFGKISIDIRQTLTQLDRLLETLSGEHQEYKNRYAILLSDPNNIGKLKEIKNAYLKHQMEASKVLYKASKYHHSFNQSAQLSSHLEKSFFILKERLGYIASSKIDNPCEEFNDNLNIALN